MISKLDSSSPCRARLLEDIYAGPPWSRVTVKAGTVVLAMPAWNQPDGPEHVAFWIYPTSQDASWWIHAEGPYGVGVYESDLDPHFDEVESC